MNWDRSDSLQVLNWNLPGSKTCSGWRFLYPACRSEVVVKETIDIPMGCL